MGAPSPAAGWYPDPTGKPMQRYFDGAQWTENYAPVTPQAAGVITVGGVNHVLHAIITLFMCGLWLPFWIILAATETKRTLAVDVYGNVIQARRPRRPPAAIQAPAAPRQPGDPPPSAVPDWILGLGQPVYLITGLVLVLAVVGLAVTALIIG